MASLDRLPCGDFQLGYRPCLDGMRGFAISAVIAFHGGVPFLQGGFIGVDVFFVLSGFLITSLLIQEWDRHRLISLRNFYIRRALRLLPALLALLLVYVLLSYLILPKEIAVENYRDSLIALFYSSNWTRAFGLIRPDGLYRPDLLGHTWSLSIEEQYYLLWPLLLLAMLRYAPSRQAMSGLLIAAILLVWLGRALMCSQGVPIERMYNGLDSRADSLLVGALLAVILSAGLIPNTGFSRAVIRFAAAISLLGLLGLSITARWDQPSMYYIWFSLIAVLAACLSLHLLIEENGALGRIFGWPPLVWFGQISYGLYLWHYPVFRLIEAREWPWLGGFLVGLAVTLSVAVLSYYVLERPLLRHRSRFQNPLSGALSQRPAVAERTV